MYSFQIAGLIFGYLPTCNAKQAAGVPFPVDSLPWAYVLEEMESKYIRLNGENSTRKITIKIQIVFMCCTCW
jgi:hypothetical protein